MIACPICGARTTVVETRMTGTSARRRRRCMSIGCDGKVTTVEVVVHLTRGSKALAEGNILVPVRQLEKLRKLVAALGGGEV